MVKATPNVPVIVSVFCLTVLSLCLAGSESAETAERAAARAPGAATWRTGDVTTKYMGISGATRGPEGALFAVPERERALLLLEIEDDRVKLEFHAAITGVPYHLDTEALAWLGGSRFALGTEDRARTRTTDEIYIGALDEDARKLKVTRALKFDYKSWGMKAEPNKGIEALCFANGYLLAGAEIRSNDDHGLFAPVALYHLESGKTRALKFRLASDTGKLSSLDCRPAGDSIEVWAIERHYGITYVETFLFDPEAETSDLKPTVYRDLGKDYSKLPNFESIGWSNGELWAITDNYSSGRRGPTLFITNQR